MCQCYGKELRYPKLKWQVHFHCAVWWSHFSIIECFFVSVADPLSSWSADECANFVSGLRQYGKDFYQIHQNKVLKVLSTFTCPTYQNCFGVVSDLRM